MVPIDDYAEKPDMDINEVEITEDSEKIKEIARSMLNRTTGSIRTRSLVYFKNTISGRENYQVCQTEEIRSGNCRIIVWFDLGLCLSCTFSL